MQTLNTNLDLKLKRVFVRCDLDVPVENGLVKEAYRLEAALPTLNLLKQAGAKIIIAGHMGKPEGKLVYEFSTKQLLPFFNEKLGEGNFELLENLRFDSREETNDENYARELASKADIYVNESFATSHREHASIVGVPKYLPHFAGLQFAKEVENLSKVLKNPEKPFIAIIGGAKLESKKPVVSKFLQIADFVLLGQKLGLDWREPVPQNLVLPIDYNDQQWDIGPITAAKYAQIISTAKTIVWCGPMGVFEEPEHSMGTKTIGEAVVNSGAFSVAGGGNTVDALDRFGFFNKINFVSTGGSAMLEFLVNETLPGLEALNA